MLKLSHNFIQTIKFVESKMSTSTAKYSMDRKYQIICSVLQSGFCEALTREYKA